MPTWRARVTAAGRIVIPAAVLREVGLEVGEAVVVRIEDGEIRIVGVRQAVSKAQEIVRHHVPNGRSLVDELLAERRGKPGVAKWNDGASRRRVSGP